MRVVRRRHVIQGKKNAGDNLRNEKEQQPRAEDISPLGSAWNWLVERLMEQRVDARTLVQPLDEPGTRLEWTVAQAQLCWSYTSSTSGHYFFSGN